MCPHSWKTAWASERGSRDRRVLWWEHSFRAHSRGMRETRGGEGAVVYGAGPPTRTPGIPRSAFSVLTPRRACQEQPRPPLGRLRNSGSVRLCLGVDRPLVSPSKPPIW